jgi:tetratricopeptide (TPR) repeat protein
MNTKRRKKFGTCRFCGASVKIENMAAHEMKVHPSLVPKEREASSLDAREIARNSDEIRALCREASKLLHSGQTTEAIKKYEQALKFDPDSYEAWNDIGLAWEEIGNDRKALEAYIKSLKAKPDLACAWVNKARLILRLGKKEEALRCYEEALKYDDTIIQAWQNKGSILASMKMYEDAIRCFDAALALNDEYYMAWMAKGQMLMLLDETEESQHCLEKAYSLNPRYAWKTVADLITGEDLEHASGISAKRK